MAFADDLRAANISADMIAARIESALPKTYSMGRNFLISLTATAITDYTVLFVDVPVTLGQVVLVGAGMNVSNDTAGQIMQMFIYRDAVDLFSDARCAAFRGSNGGYDHNLTLFGRDTTPPTGTNRYKIRWAKSGGVSYSIQAWIVAVSLWPGN